MWQCRGVPGRRSRSAQSTGARRECMGSARPASHWSTDELVAVHGFCRRVAEDQARSASGLWTPYQELAPDHRNRIARESAELT
jgi:hypothetical protein